MLTGLAWLDALTTNFFQPVFGMNAAFPVGSTSLQIQTAQGYQLGLALGSTINSSVDPNAPLNPNIPYLYYVVSGGLAGKFDNVSIGVAQTMESIIVDPADPMVYYGLILPALPVFASAGFGLSANGLIPFTPFQKPSQFSGSLSGNVYAQLELNLPIPELPVLAVNVNATTVIDLNANHDGAWLNYLESNPGTFIAALVNGGLPAVVATNPALAADVAFGVNGSVGLTVNTVNNLLSITVSPAQGTLIDTGTTSPNVYFRGLATNGFASGNLLQNFTSFLSPNQTFILDGAYLSATSTLSASYMAQYSYFGFSANSTTTFTGTNLLTPAATFSATSNGTLSFLGGSIVSYTGSINSAGQFTLTGTANVTIGGFTLSTATVQVNNQGITLSGQTNLGPIGTASFTSTATTNGNFFLTATASTNFGIALAPEVDAQLTLSNAGLNASTTVAFLGQQASLEGSIQPNLSFTLTGTVTAQFSFAGIGPSALVTVTMANQGGAVSLSGSFDLQFSLLVTSFDLNGTIFLAYAGGAPTYSGSLQLTRPVSAMIAVMNNALLIDLPLIPTFTIPLPS